MATAATASVGAITAPSMNAAGHGNPSTSTCAATATTQVVTRTSASASSPSARLSAFSSRGEEYQPGAQQQRRHEDQQHDVRVHVDVLEPRHEGQREPAEHEHDRVRNANVLGHPHEQHGTEQEGQEELEVAHRSAGV